MKKYLLMAMAVLAALSLMVAGCGGKEEAKKAEPAKVLRVGTEPTFAPFEFQKEGSKEYTGFDMDLIRAIGKQMGYKVEIMNMGFDALIPALSSGNIDTVIAGMSITPERQEAVLFSAPYYRSGLVVMVQKNNDTIKGIEDLVGKRIAVQIGTTGAASRKRKRCQSNGIQHEYRSCYGIKEWRRGCCYQRQPGSWLLFGTRR